MWDSVEKGYDGQKVKSEMFMECKVDEKCFWGDLHNVFIGWSKVFWPMVMNHGILLCMVFVHGFWPILILGFFVLFGESGDMSQ